MHCAFELQVRVHRCAPPFSIGLHTSEGAQSASAEQTSSSVRAPPPVPVVVVGPAPPPGPEVVASVELELGEPVLPPAPPAPPAPAGPEGPPPYSHCAIALQM